MKIAVYADEMAKRGESGVKNYSIEIVKELLRIDDKNEYTLYSRENIEDKIAPYKARIVCKWPWMRKWAFFVFALLVQNDQPDVVFMPIQTFPFLIVAKKRPKTVVTVHDVAFLFFPHHFNFWKRQYLRFNTRRAVRLADRIIVPSEATKRDLVRSYKVPECKIKVVYHGVSKDLQGLAQKNDPRVNGLSKGCPYILFVGAIQPRKNIVRLVKAFDMLKKTGKYEHKLIICGGKGWLYWKVFDAIRLSAFHDDIIVVGDAGNDLLASLYAGADLLVMPSLYEGFGLPVLEAMSFGVPVICANNSSLSEIADDAALLFDGYSAAEIYRKMDKVLGNRKVRDELSVKGLRRVREFSWEKAARETLEVLEKVAK
jgi:glycosyltransferase involved in cell wall biosynthesis